MGKKITKKNNKAQAKKGLSLPLNYKYLTTDTMIEFITKKDRTEEGRAFLEELAEVSNALARKKLFKERYAYAFETEEKVSASDKLKAAASSLKMAAIATAY